MLPAYNIPLTHQQLELVMGALSELPFKQVASTINHLLRVTQEQAMAAAAAAEEGKHDA